MRRGFTLIELICAVVLVGLMTTYAMLTFRSVSRSWQVSTDYIDKLQRTDFALNQVVSALRSAYYPHDGKQDSNYGMSFENNGDGEDPDRSDVIGWSACGTAIIGNKSAVADTVHRIQLMVLEEGNTDYKDRIEVTGLYARCWPVGLDRDESEEDDDVDWDEMYQPVLIADGIVGFNCRFLEDKSEVKKAENDESLFKDERSDTNGLPYKVELTFMLADADGRSYRSNTAPVMRIVRLPLHEQSKDGWKIESEKEKKNAPNGRRGTRGNKNSGNKTTTGGNKSGGSAAGGGNKGGALSGGGLSGGRGGGR